MHKWKGNIFKEMTYTGLNLIKMTKNRVQWQGLLNTVMYLWVQCMTISNSRPLFYTWSVRKVSDRIFLCEHLMDYNLARLHELTLNLSAHA